MGETANYGLYRRNPACAIFEEGEAIKVVVEMPGVSREGLSVSLEGSELAIEGRPGPEGQGPQDGRYLLRERARGSYRKVFSVDESIDRDGVDARLANGVLTLTLKVKAAAKPRRIEIA